MDADPYPALTVRNPWAWALLHGKPVENRSWEMTHRGPLWLHAGARSRWDPAGAASFLVEVAWRQYLHDSVPGWPGLPSSDVELGRKTTLMPFGAVTALIEVTGCHHATECAGNATADELGRRGHLLCTPWSAFGQFHIEQRTIAVLPDPVPCRGMLGLWRLPGDVEKRVREQLEASDD